MPTKFVINGKAVESSAPPHIPLLWVIREEIKLTGMAAERVCAARAWSISKANAPSLVRLRCLKSLVRP